MFNAYACALEGMWQALAGIVKSRVLWLNRAGPPNAPTGLRVSATRHGVTGINCSGADSNAREWITISSPALLTLVELPFCSQRFIRTRSWPGRRLLRP